MKHEILESIDINKLNLKELLLLLKIVNKINDEIEVLE